MTFFSPSRQCVISTLLPVHNEGLRCESARKADRAENAALIYAGEWNRCGYDFVIMLLSEREEAKGYDGREEEEGG